MSDSIYVMLLGLSYSFRTSISFVQKKFTIFARVFCSGHDKLTTCSNVWVTRLFFRLMWFGVRYSFRTSIFCTNYISRFWLGCLFVPNTTTCLNVSDSTISHSTCSRLRYLFQTRQHVQAYLTTIFAQTFSWF